MLSEKMFEGLNEKEIIALQLSEIQKTGLFRGQYIIEITSFDGRRISARAFENHDEALNFYNNATKDYCHSAYVRFHIDFTLF